MIELLLICSTRAVDPLLNREHGEALTEAIVIQGERAEAEGILPQSVSVSAKSQGDGSVVLNGIQMPDGVNVWAVLKPTGSAYALEWLMPGTVALDGRATATVWKRGTCLEKARNAE